MLQAKISNSIWGFIIGDVYGVPFEFKNQNQISEVELTSGGIHNQPLGTWSDDTSLTLATMDSIIECGKINIWDMRSKFENWAFNAKYASDDIVFDIGNTTIEALRTGKGKNDKWSNGNGSLMRMLPIAIFTYGMPKRKISSLVGKVSSITHAHQISIDTCFKYVNFFHLLMDGKSRAGTLKSSGMDYIIFKSKDSLDTKGYVVGSLDAAIWCFMNTNNYLDSIKLAISLGNDTDTIAAITGSLSGFYYGGVQDMDKVINKGLAEKIIDDFIYKYCIYLKN